MARIRTIKPEFWESEKVGRMTPLARLTFIGLISLADDEGRGRGDADFLWGRLFSYTSKTVKAAFKKALTEIERVKLAVFYSGPGNCRYYLLPGWREHQKIEKPSASKLPAPPVKFGEHSPSPPRTLTEESLLDQGSGKGKDQGKEGEEDGAATMSPAPSPGSSWQEKDLGTRKAATAVYERLKAGAVMGSEEQLRQYAMGWITSHGEATVRQVLDMAGYRGRDILWINRTYFTSKSAPALGADCPQCRKVQKRDGVHLLNGKPCSCNPAAAIKEWEDHQAFLKKVAQ